MTIVFVSNGHGEDTIGAALAAEFTRLGIDSRALPLVGRGCAYSSAGIEIVGPARELPSGGYLLGGPRRLLADLRAGFVRVTAGQWSALRGLVPSVDACLAVGDWYALATAAFFGKRPLFHVQSAVSVKAWPEDAPPWKAPFGPFERSLMKGCAAVYPRDGESVRWLSSRGLPNVHDLGNPMLDAVEGDAALPLPGPYLLLLPGSRGDAQESLPVMLEACRLLASTDLAPVVAWSGPQDPRPPAGWRAEATGWGAGTGQLFLHGDGTRVQLARGAFATALDGARVAISTSGTAAEQCAGRGVPLVGFPTSGPQYTVQFAAAQKRALGAALTLTEASPAAVARAVRSLLDDGGRRARARADGRLAMGEPGAAARIAAHVHSLLRARQEHGRRRGEDNPPHALEGDRR